MYKAVVFDLDHTLFDRYATFKSILKHEEAYTVFNSEFGKENIFKLWSELDKKHIHQPSPWELIFDEFKRQNTVLPTVKKDDFYRNVIAKLFKLTAVPYDDTETTLTALKNAGLKLGIITNGYPEIQQSKIDLLRIGKYFNEIILSGTYNTQKPDRILFDIMAERLQLDPHEILFVGDHPLNDIEGARNAGFKTAWINATGFWALPEIERADYEIDSLCELLNILQI